MTFKPEQVRKYFEARLQGQRLTQRDQVAVRCPFHDDRSASMSINISRAVWTCHAGCGSGGLLDFEQKLTGCDRDTAKANVSELLGEKQMFAYRQPPEAVYKYCDAHGKLVAEKLRYRNAEGAKYFAWRRPSGQGGYDYKLDGFKPPLYRLVELVRSNFAIVVEGEKDADRVVEALADQPLAVTTSPDGAAKPGQAPKWRPEFNAYFTGKAVAILPDNDAPGQAHAEVVAQGIAPYAAGVKVVTLSGLAEGGDVSDFLQTHSGAELLQEIKQAHGWKPTAATDDGFFVDAAAFSNSVPDAIDWAVKPIIPRGWNGFIIADPKSLKSYSALDLVISLSLGQPWLGFEVPRRMRTALLAREDYWGLTAWRMKHFLRERQQRLGWEMEPEIKNWMWINTRQQAATWLLDNDADLEKLIFELKRRAVEFVIMDVFRKLHRCEENDNTDMQTVLDRVSRIQAEVGCAVGIVHHANKQDGWIFNRVRGASAIHGFMEWGIGLTTENPEDPPSERVRKMEFLTKAGSEPDAIYVKSEGGEAQGAIRLVRADYTPPTRGGGRSAERIRELLQ